ncbi:hypothetical protein Godav_002776, partial [Gossypium davidsonii]|nr:hypothetical protein [Gossypium davidsonii]
LFNWLEELALRFIGGAIGLVAKIDRNTKNNTREYESLPPVCFKCGRWVYTRENCIHKQGKENLLEAEESSKSDQVLGLQRRAEVEDFGSWKIVEWKQRRRAQPLEGMNNGKGNKALNGSKFDVIRIE